MRSRIAKNGREEDVLVKLDRVASRQTHAALCWSIALVYLLAFAVAVYYRITISDWLAEFRQPSALPRLWSRAGLKRARE
jgi:hypothetical protein